MALSLIDERYFTIKYSFGKKVEKVLNLPELLYALCQNEPFSLRKLQAHQQHGVYSFLANLMALCLDQEIDIEDESVISVDVLRNKTVADWKKLLIGLTDGHQTAFDFVVEDVSKPAFFQPITKLQLTGDADLIKKKNPARETPDNFSITHDKQDFDIKRNRNDKKDIELWIYALIVMQTCCNYGGRTWNKSIKTASGYKMRICASFVDKPFLTSRIQRDVPLLLASRAALVKSYGYTSKFKLLWLLERTESSQIELQDCHPLFIECVRIHRLTQTEAGINVFGIGNKFDFIKNTKDYRGVVGDFWLPIKRFNSKKEEEISAFSLREDGSGFDYKQTTAIMLGSEIETPAVALKNEKKSFKQGFLLLEGIGGGVGKTSGFHKKYLVMTKGMLSRLSKASEDLQLAEALQALTTKFFGYIDLVWRNLVKDALELQQFERALKWEGIFSETKFQYEDHVEHLLSDALSSYAEQDENTSTAEIEKNFVMCLDQLAFEIREQIFQRFFANATEKYVYFAQMNSNVYTKKFILNKQISFLEITPHMSHIQIPIRSRIYAQVSSALELIHRNAQNTSFLSDLRKPSSYATPEFNPTYQEMIAQIYNKSLKSANLSEKEIQLWQHLFSWMRTSKATKNTEDLGTICAKASVNDRRLLSLLQQSEEALIVEIESVLSMIRSNRFEPSKNAWVDIATILFSEGTDDAINVRKVVANSYYHAVAMSTEISKANKNKTQTETTTESNTVEQKNV